METPSSVHHVGLAVEDLDGALDTYERFFGARLERRSRVDEQGVEAASIRVWPQVVLQSVDRHGQHRVGVMKLYFSKHHPLDERSGQYIATLLQAFAEQHLAPLGPVDPRLVRVVDVFAGREYLAPKARTRRLCDVQVACEEIAARWPVQ